MTLSANAPEAQKSAAVKPRLKNSSIQLELLKSQGSIHSAEETEPNTPTTAAIKPLLFLLLLQGLVTVWNVKHFAFRMFLPCILYVFDCKKQFSDPITLR